MKHKHEKKDNSVYVRIPNPIESRKAVLEEAIGVVELLKRYQKIKDLKAEKEKTLEEFRATMRKVNNLLRMIRLEEMPMEMDDLERVKNVKNKLVFAKEKEKNFPTKTEKKEIIKKAKVLPLPPRDPLDVELDNLKRKLGTM